MSAAPAAVELSASSSAASVVPLYAVQPGAQYAQPGVQYVQQQYAQHPGFYAQPMPQPAVAPGAATDLQPFNDVALPYDYCHCHKACACLLLKYIAGIVAAFFSLGFYIYTYKKQEEHTALDKIAYIVMIAVFGASQYLALGAGFCAVHTSKLSCFGDYVCREYYMCFNPNQSFCAAVLCCRLTEVHYIRFLFYNRYQDIIGAIAEVIQAALQIYQGEIGSFVAAGVLGVSVISKLYDVYSWKKEFDEKCKEYRISPLSDPTIPDM